ncbi:MAG: hypothetical protein LCH26_07045 [Proteobacteria bacterium]|nr:hypothetical protein [Pseudomonadota bacterium]
MQNKFMKAVLVATALVSGNLFATAHDQDFADVWAGTKTAYELAPGVAKGMLTDIDGAEVYTDRAQDAIAALLAKAQAPLVVTVNRTSGEGMIEAHDNADPLHPVARTVLPLAVAEHFVPNVQHGEPDVDMTDEINKVVLGLVVENVHAKDSITALTAQLAARPTQRDMDDAVEAARDARGDITPDDLRDLRAELAGRPTVGDVAAARQAGRDERGDITPDDLRDLRDELVREKAEHAQQSAEVRLILDAVNALRRAASEADYATSRDLAADLPNLLAALTARPVVTTTTRTTTTTPASSSSSSAPAIAIPAELQAASTAKQDAYRNWQALANSGAPRRAVLTAKAAFDSITS